MLDGEGTVKDEDTMKAEDTLEAAKGEDTLEAEREELIVGFEGEEAEPGGEGDDEDPNNLSSPPIRALRAAKKEAERQAKEAKRELARLLAERAEAEAPPPERPRIEDYDWDHEKHDAAVDAWHAGKAERDAKAKAKAEAEEAKMQAAKAKADAYHEAKAKLAVPDFKEAEDAVVSAFSLRQQQAIIQHIKNPAQFAYALGKSDKLDELAKLGETPEFLVELIRLEGKLRVETRKFAPESKMPGTAAGGGGSLRAQYERAAKEAERTGNRTEVIRLKNLLRKAGQEV